MFFFIRVTTVMVSLHSNSNPEPKRRKRSSSREAMERTEFSKDATRLLKEFQYLRTDREVSCLTPAVLHHLSPVCPAGPVHSSGPC